MIDNSIIDCSGVFSLEVGSGRPWNWCWLVGLALNSSVGFGYFIGFYKMLATDLTKKYEVKICPRVIFLASSHLSWGVGSLVPDTATTGESFA
jgi:hypothetical protein